MISLVTASLPIMTTPFQLTARLKHPEISTAYAGCYAYDEPSIGLIAEPLVHSTTAVIQHLFGAPHPDERSSLFDPHSPECVVLTFSTDRQRLPSADALVQLRLTDTDDDGSDYIVSVLHSSHKIPASRTERPLNAWLCQHLCDYFSAPPDVFYCAIQQA